MRPSRPLSISLLSWTLIFLSVLEFMTFDWARQNGGIHLLTERSPLPVVGPLSVCFAVAALTGLCGILFLKGINWARFLLIAVIVWRYVDIWRAHAFHAVHLPGLAIVAGVLFVLFRPRANLFFGSGKPDLRGLYWRGH